MKKRKLYSKKSRKLHIVSSVLTITMLMSVLGGCGKAGQGVNGDTNDANQTIPTASDNTDTNTQLSSGDSADAGAMGRYVENVTDMSDVLGYDNSLYRLADGRLVITGASSHPFYVSDDNGETWEEDDWAWHKKIMDNEYYVGGVAIGSDGTAAVIYDATEESEYEPTLLVVKPDGMEIPIETPSDVLYPFKAAVTDSGRVFVSCLGSDNIYEAKDDGSCELFLALQEERPGMIQTQGNLLLLDGYGYGAPLIYDIEKEEYIEDEVLKDFCSENYSKGNSYGSSAYEVYYFPGEEGVLYIAGEKGLHRHVIGGGAVEQVIDGGLCTFNNPAYSIYGMVMLPDNEFMTLFTGGRLVHFVYDKDVPTVPNERLKVYSLKDNDTVRQAMTLYQTLNPDVYVEYEVGMGESNSVTRDDALKNLNTKIMAGEGPDILILDNMPLDSYIEKGLLLDLAPLLTGLSGEDALFENIVDAMKTGDKIYAMPCGIQVPVMTGEEKYISMAGDLKGLADMIEELRKDNPGKNLMNICSERGVMRYFAMTSAPAWTNETGGIDRDAVKEFLEQTKRIYDAEIEGISDEMIEQFKEADESWLEEMGERRTDSKYFRLFYGGINYIGGYSKMCSGALEGLNSYANLISVNKVSGFENSVWTLMNGQSENIFCAQTLLGINAASQYTQQAQDFIKVCLGKENQSSMVDNLMVNKAAFDESFAVDTTKVDETGAYSWTGSSTQDGESVDFIIYWPDEQQTAELKSCIESLDTPYLENNVLEDAVYEEGGKYFRGEQSLEAAVNEVEKKMALYLAE